MACWSPVLGCATSFLRDVRGLFESEAATLLTLEDASAVSGYTVDHLGRQVREAVIPNAGRKGSPRICARDIPRKPKGPESNGRTRSYDPQADARTLLARQIVGRHPQPRAGRSVAKLDRGAGNERP